MLKITSEQVINNQVLKEPPAAGRTQLIWPLGKSGSLIPVSGQGHGLQKRLC